MASKVHASTPSSVTTLNVRVFVQHDQATNHNANQHFLCAACEGPQPRHIAVTKGAGVPKGGMFLRFRPKWYVVFFPFFDSSSSIIVFVADTHFCRSATSTKHTVRRQICCLSRASGVIVVVSGPSMVSVVFRLVRSWVLCNSGFWLRLFVARFLGWLTLVEVFAVVTTLECLAFCRTLWPVRTFGRRQVVSSRLRLQAAAASCAHVSCAGVREPVAWVKMQLTRNRHSLMF